MSKLTEVQFLQEMDKSITPHGVKILEITGRCIEAQYRHYKEKRSDMSKGYIFRPYQVVIRKPSREDLEEDHIHFDFITLSGYAKADGLVYRFAIQLD